MKYALIYIVCFVLMGILGCSTISTKEIKKQDLYLHCYACDSLGVEKTSFGRNERWFFGFVLKNVSNQQIKYKANPPILLEPSLIYPNGRIIINPIDAYVEENIRSEYFLVPGEHISMAIEYHHELNAILGKYTAKMNFLIQFDNDSYNKVFFKNSKRNVSFFVKE